MRKSIEFKQRADTAYQKAKGILDLLEKEGRDPTEDERQAVDNYGKEMDAHLATAESWRKIEDYEAGRTAEEPPSPPGPTQERTEKPFRSLGQQLQAIHAATAGRGNVEEARNMLQAAASGSSEAVDSEGGYLLQADFAVNLEKEMFGEGTLLSLMGTPIEVSNQLGLMEKVIDEKSRVAGSRYGAVQGYWVEEAEAATASKPKFRKRHTELNRVAALGYATEELLSDAPALGGLYQEAFRNELIFMTEDAIFAGDGVGKPYGMFTGTAGGNFISVSKETNQAGSTIVTTNLSKMWQRLIPRGKSRSIWAINSDCGPQLDELSLAVGTGGLQPRFVNYNQAGILTIKGRPVVELEYCATLGTINDIVLIDPMGYRLIRKGGVDQASSVHVKFTTHEMTFRASYRVGGQPKLSSEITPYKGSNTLAHFIALATRS